MCRLEAVRDFLRVGQEFKLEVGFGGWEHFPWWDGARHPAQRKEPEGRRRGGKEVAWGGESPGLPGAERPFSPFLPFWTRVS